MIRRLSAVTYLIAVLCLHSPVWPQDSANSRDSGAVIGCWDLTVDGENGPYPCWIEIQRSGRRTLVGRYVGQFGSARPISHVAFDDGVIRFVVPPQWEDRKTDVVVEGKIDGEALRGEVTGDREERLRWTAQRAPKLDRDAPKSWGAPIPLFNGRDLGGWKTRHATKKNGWIVREGILVNAEPGNDLISEQKFNDFKLHAEFRFPAGSNSGLYLRGRYEVQIEDSFGRDADSHRFGGVYGFLTPSLNAAKPAGQWQSLEITLVGRHVTVILNGERIIDRQSIPGITGGALDSREQEPGPIMIQGDHGAVEFRVVTLTPAIAESK